MSDIMHVPSVNVDSVNFVWNNSIQRVHRRAGHNLTGIASQFAMHLGFTCDVISVTHRSD